jgi:D-alanyl-D-alanine carboxypeptidase/D-alanyl-D-alanine-endopeptidase (penicillin-binding protein 4)
MYRAVQDPAKYTAGLFVSMWRQQGGTIKGTMRKGRVPINARILYSAPSLPLANIIRSINKYSNNVMTRHLLLTVTAESVSIPATEKQGEGVVKRWMRAQKIPVSGFRLENGAGLSRSTRISAFQLGKVLKTAYSKAYMPELMSSLPITGVDGTMRRRKLTKESHGRMHLKSGLLENVRSTAGYFVNGKGRRYVVVIMHNHETAHTGRGKRLQDKILNWLYKHSP